MYDWEDEPQDFNLNEELEKFEAELNADSVGFYDSDRFEAIVDHYLIAANYSKAAQAAQLAFQQYPFHALFIVRRAQALSGMGNLKEGLHLLADAEKMEGPSLESVLTKAAIFSQLRDSKQAIRLYKQALELADQEDKDEIFLDLATELEQLRDYSGAIEVLEKAMKCNPKNEGALYELAFCFDQLGDYRRAVKSYTDFLDDNPYSFTAWYNLGNTFSKEDKFPDAITAYEYCLAINDQFAPAYFNLGNALLSNDQHNQAIECFQKCLDLDGDDALTLCYIGEAYEQLEELDTSWDYYQKSVSLAPGLAEAWLGLGIVMDLRGKSQEALSYIERAIELEPAMDGYYHVYASALENCGRIEDAEKAYLACLELDPENEDGYLDYVDFLCEHDFPRARPFVEQYIQEHPKFFTILPMIYINWLTNRLHEAKLILTECFSRDPEATRGIFDRYTELAEVAELVNLTR